VAVSPRDVFLSASTEDRTRAGGGLRGGGGERREGEEISYPPRRDDREATASFGGIVMENGRADEGRRGPTRGGSGGEYKARARVLLPCKKFQWPVESWNGRLLIMCIRVAYGDSNGCVIQLVRHSRTLKVITSYPRVSFRRPHAFPHMLPRDAPLPDASDRLLPRLSL